MDSKLPPIRYLAEAAAFVLLMIVLATSSTDSLEAQASLGLLDADFGTDVFSAEHPRQIWVSLQASYLPPQLAA